MTFKQFFFIPVFISVLAVTLVMLAKPSPLVIPYLWTWIAFQAWAMYFMAGCTIKGGVKTFLGYAAGAVAAIAIFELMGVMMSDWMGVLLKGGKLGWNMGAAPALAIAVFIVVIPVISSERIPYLDFVPAWFVGAGVVFGILSIKTVWPEGAGKWTKYGITVTHLMVSCLVGLIYGVVTVFIRTKYEAWIKAKQPGDLSGVASAKTEAEAETPADG